MYDICWSMINDQLLIIGYDHWSCYDQLLIISYDHWSLPWSTVDHTLWSLIIAMKRLLIIHDVLHYHVTMKVIVTTNWQLLHCIKLQCIITLLAAQCNALDCKLQCNESLMLLLAQFCFDCRWGGPSDCNISFCRWYIWCQKYYSQLNSTLNSVLLIGLFFFHWISP